MNCVKKIFLAIFIIVNTIIIYANSVIETKNIDGVTYKLIQTTAKVTYAGGNNNEVIGKDLYFYNTQGKIALSDISQKELEPYAIKQKITIYYVENSNEPNKQLFRVYTNKKDVQWGAAYKSNEVGFSNHFDSNKIKKSPIHSFSGYKMKLISENGGTLYRFVGNYGILPFILFVFIGFVTLLFLRSGNIGGVAIGILSGLFVYFTMFSIAEEEKSVFDLNNKEFYKGSTIVKAKNNGNRYAKFKNIYGFQILEDEDCNTRGSGVTRYEECYDIYELNLVLLNNDRINIICHSDYKQIEADAKQLSTILNKPLMNEVD